LILTILDGWGFSPAVEGNAIAAARKPTYDKLLREFPGKAAALICSKLASTTSGISAGRSGRG